jgi:hypothetical protein
MPDCSGIAQCDWGWALPTLLAPCEGCAAFWHTYCVSHDCLLTWLRESCCGNAYRLGPLRSPKPVVWNREWRAE